MAEIRYEITQQVDPKAIKPSFWVSGVSGTLALSCLLGFLYSLTHDAVVRWPVLIFAMGFGAFALVNLFSRAAVWPAPRSVAFLDTGVTFTDIDGRQRSVPRDQILELSRFDSTTRINARAVRWTNESGIADLVFYLCRVPHDSFLVPVLAQKSSAVGAYAQKIAATPSRAVSEPSAHSWMFFMALPLLLAVAFIIWNAKSLSSETLLMFLVAFVLLGVSLWKAYTGIIQRASYTGGRFLLLGRFAAFGKQALIYGVIVLIAGLLVVVTVLLMFTR